MSHDIFISYSRRDSERMGQVRDTLRGSGLEVWTDEGIEPGTESWKGSISGAIMGCKALVVLFSPDATQSTWVNRELDFAELHHKKIYPLLVRGELAESIPFGYTTYQYIDIRDDAAVSSGVQQLIATLHSHFGDGLPITTIAHPTPSHSPVRHEVNRKPSVRSDHDGETLWKWVETPPVRLTLPATWKVHECSDENIQKAQILMIGKDETLFYRAIEDHNRDFIYHATGIPFGRLAIINLITDIAEMSPLVGYISIYTAPYPIPGVGARPAMTLLGGRIAHFARQRYRMEMSPQRWIRGSASQICSNVWQLSAIIENTEAMAGKVYTLFLPLSRRVLFLNIACEPERFKREEPLFDQVARSLQFAWD